MRSVGIAKEVLSPREVADLVPLIRTEDVVHGFWTPDEGRANPVDVTMSLAKGARQRGVRIFENTEVTGFVLEQRPGGRRPHRARRPRVREGRASPRGCGAANWPPRQA